VEFLIFPEDIQKVTRSKQSMKTNEKSRVIIGITVLINAFIYFLLSPTLEAWGLPKSLFLTIQIILLVLLGGFIFRIFVVKEDERIQEIEENKKDSFSKFFKLRNLESEDIKEINGIKVPVYEYSNGNSLLYIKLLIGEGGRERKEASERMLTEMLSLFGRHNLSFKLSVGKEKFEKSPEAAAYLAHLKSIKNPKLARMMRATTDNLFTISEKESNVDCLTITVATTSSYQRYDLKLIIQGILNIFGSSKSNFRYLSFLYSKSVIDFYKEYYGLGAVDTTLLQVSESISYNKMESPYVQVYSLKDEFGETIAKEDLLEEKIPKAKRIK
jgi:hypothetical protein